MKKILSLCLFLLGLNCLEARIDWVNFNDAFALQKSSSKQIVMVIYGDTLDSKWKRLDGTTLKDPQVEEYLNTQVISVLFSGKGGREVEYKGVVYKNPEYTIWTPKEHSFSKYLKLEKFPAVVIFNAKGEVEAIKYSRFGPDSLLKWLKENR